MQGLRVDNAYHDCGKEVNWLALLNAFCDLAALEVKQGIDAYLVLPMSQEGQVVRVFLKVSDPKAEILEVLGIERVDLAQYIPDASMIRNYLYRERDGANTSWGYTPIHRLGKPKSNREKNRELFWGKTGQWRHDKDSHLFKLQNRLLADFEKEGCFTTGSVARAMQDLELKLDSVLDDLDPKKPAIIVFGVDDGGRFVYPGEIPAFVRYFEKKLAASLAKRQAKEPGQGQKRYCALCRRQAETLTPLDKVFNFATFDKANVLPALDKREGAYVFAVCTECLEKLSTARERVDRALSNTTAIPDLRLWIVPETAGPGTAHGRLKTVVKTLESELAGGELNGLPENLEQGYFSRIAREGQGLVFHFVFWERSQAQEIVHLMVEDIPPERLGLLERLWREVGVRYFGNSLAGFKLHEIFRSLYTTMVAFTGDGKSDAKPIREFILQVIGHMLQGRAVPVEMFKQHLVTRIPGTVYGDTAWDKIQTAVRFAQLWADYMYRLNEEVML